METATDGPIQHHVNTKSIPLLEAP
jgi:hypothetical protein